MCKLRVIFFRFGDFRLGEVAEQHEFRLAWRWVETSCGCHITELLQCALAVVYITAEEDYIVRIGEVVKQRRLCV